MSIGSDLREDSELPEDSDAKDRVDDGSSLLETVVNAHYLALQMRMLVKGRRFMGSEATELLASALTEWAQLAGGECFEEGSALATVTARGKH